MPHLSGVFDQFPGLERVSIEQLLAWISQKPDVHIVVNFLGNRILYPQTIPLTKEEMELDFALLKAGIRLKPSLVFQPQTNKIVIPKLFVERFLPLKTMVLSIIEGINPKGVHLIYYKDGSQLKILGSVISPLNPQKLSSDGKTVNVTIGKQIQTLPLNAISVIKPSVADAKILLGNEEFKAPGGAVGLVVDLRLGGFG